MMGYTVKKHSRNNFTAVAITKRFLKNFCILSHKVSGFTQTAEGDSVPEHSAMQIRSKPQQDHHCVCSAVCSMQYAGLNCKSSYREQDRQAQSSVCVTLAVSVSRDQENHSTTHLSSYRAARAKPDLVEDEPALPGVFSLLPRTAPSLSPLPMMPTLSTLSALTCSHTIISCSLKADTGFLVSSSLCSSAHHRCSMRSLRVEFSLFFCLRIQILYVSHFTKNSLVMDTNLSSHLHVYESDSSLA